jgi:hypothetical protein
LNLIEGIGVGLLYPKTNSMLLGKERHDDFHVSGYGVSAKVGLNITFYKHFFIQTELKGGYINMPKKDGRTMIVPAIYHGALLPILVLHLSLNYNFLFYLFLFLFDLVNQL